MEFFNKFLKNIKALQLDESELQTVKDLTDTDETEEEEDIDLKLSEKVKNLKKSIRSQFKNLIDYVFSLRSKGSNDGDELNIISDKVKSILDTINTLKSTLDLKESEFIDNLLQSLTDLKEFLNNSPVSKGTAVEDRLVNKVVEALQVWLYLQENSPEFASEDFKLSMNNFKADLMNILNKSVDSEVIEQDVNKFINDLKIKSGVDFTSIDLSNYKDKANNIIDNFEQYIRDVSRRFWKESIKPFYIELLTKINNTYQLYTEFSTTLTNYIDVDIEEKVSDSINIESSLNLTFFQKYLYGLLDTTQRELKYNQPITTYTKVRTTGGVNLNEKELLRVLGSVFLGSAYNPTDFTTFENLVADDLKDITVDTRINDAITNINNALVFTSVSSTMDNLQKFLRDNNSKLFAISKRINELTAKPAIITRKILKEDIVDKLNRINNALIKMVIPVISLENNLDDIELLNIDDLIPEDKRELLKPLGDYKAVYTNTIDTAKTFLESVTEFTTNTFNKIPKVEKTDDISKYRVEDINEKDKINLTKLLIDCNNFINKDIGELKSNVERLQSPLILIEKILNKLK